jgi:hypothetical protein
MKLTFKLLDEGEVKLHIFLTKLIKVKVSNVDPPGTSNFIM